MFIRVNSDLSVNADCIEAVQYNEKESECEIILRRETVPDSVDVDIFPPRITIEMTRAEFDDIVIQLGGVR